MESGFRQLVVERLFPRVCVSCTKEGTLLCDACDIAWSVVPVFPSCAFCGRKGSVRTCHKCVRVAFLDGVSACWHYANPAVKSLIQQWKFHLDESAKEVLSRFVRKRADSLNIPILPFYSTPVPLHPRRARERGFDQAMCIANWTQEMFGLPVVSLLRRRVYTSQQSSVSSADRLLGEMDNVFVVDSDWDILPEHVLLCDDVFTTGATMDAAARVLKEAGVKTVWGFVIARK